MRRMGARRASRGGRGHEPLQVVDRWGGRQGRGSTPQAAPGVVWRCRPLMAVPPACTQQERGLQGSLPGAPRPAGAQGRKVLGAAMRPSGSSPPACLAADRAVSSAARIAGCGRGVGMRGVSRCCQPGPRVLQRGAGASPKPQGCLRHCLQPGTRHLRTLLPSHQRELPRLHLAHQR